MKEKMYGQPVAVEDMLRARDARAALQRDMLRAHGVPLLCLTMNIAGPIKVTPLIAQGYRAAIRLVEEQLARYGLAATARETIQAHTGLEAFWAVDADARRLKTLMCVLEDSDRFGRLLDLDVLDVDGGKLSRTDTGMPARTCLLCGEEAAGCARSRAHSVEALFAETEAILSAYLSAQYADHIAALAQEALLCEVAITPKPGLVDRANNGAHSDMDFFTFQRSAAVLFPYFRQCVLLGMQAGDTQGLFAGLRYPGMQAETAMLAATGGVNTHKGAIFSFGILCAALGVRRTQGLPHDTQALCRLCADMTHDTLQAEIRAIRGPAGARGEVAQGFPTVLTIGLPALTARLAMGDSLNGAGVYCLLALLAATDDANIQRRSNKARADALRAQAQALLDDYSLAGVQALDDQLIAEGLSPGGCADLLAVTLFLNALERDATGTR